MRIAVSTLKDLIIGFTAVVMVAYPREFMKGLIAYKLGDPTPKEAGRLSLNPFIHLDPIGTTTFILFDFGWSRPVPVRFWRLRNGKKGLFLVSITGPMVNLFIFFIFGFAARYLEKNSITFEFFYKTAKYSLTYSLFSLFPIPPLDGSRILGSFLPSEYTEWYMKYEVYGILFLLALVLLWIMPLVMTPFVDFIDNFVNTIVR